MAQVRMLINISGTRDGVDWPPRGSVVELPDDEANHLVAGGMATFTLVDDPEPATAVVFTPEPVPAAPAAEPPAVGKDGK